MAPVNLPTICVLLTPADDADSQSARSQLASHRWHVSTIHDPYRAVAELALRERAQAARLGWGLGRGQRIALVLHRRSAWREAHQMIAAVRRHLPKVEIWQAENHELLPVHVPAEHEDNDETKQPSRTATADAPTPFRKHSANEQVLPSAQPAVTTTRRATSPDLRLTDDPKPEPQPRNNAEGACEHALQEGDDDQGDARSTTLTSDEIRMLLADTPDQAGNM